MNCPQIRAGALAVVTSLLLAGCATGPTVGDAAKQIGLSGKTPPKEAAAAPDLPTNIENAIRQAQLQRKAGDANGAVQTLSQLVLFAPDNAEVLGEYGKALVAKGRADDALAFLERAISIQPTDWTLFSAMGVAYDQKGAYPAAQASYEQALALKPGEPTVLSNNALSHMQSGDLDGAEKLLMQAAQNGAANPRITTNLALVQRLRASKATAVAPQPVSTTAPPPTPPASASGPVRPSQDSPGRGAEAPEKMSENTIPETGPRLVPLVSSEFGPLIRQIAFTPEIYQRPSASSEERRVKGAIARKAVANIASRSQAKKTKVAIVRSVDLSATPTKALLRPTLIDGNTPRA